MADSNKKYRVDVREHHGGGLFELEITTYFDVVENSTGQVVMSFNAEYSAHYDGDWVDPVSYGVRKVEISEDEKYVLVFQSSKEEPLIYPLPV